MAHLSNTESPTQEETAVKELRLKISDVVSADAKFDDDFYLLQWLKAHKLKPDKTETMIRKSVIWRQENRIHSNPQEELPPDLMEKYKTIFSKTKNGIPIGYIKVGVMDTKQGFSEYGLQRMVQLWNVTFFRMEEEMIAYNKAQNIGTTKITCDSVKGLIVLVDIKGFSAGHLLSSNVLRGSVQIMSNLMAYFPSVAETVIFYNMNNIFKVILNTIKPFLTSPFLHMEVLGPNEKIWRERILGIMKLEDFEKCEQAWE